MTEQEIITEDIIEETILFETIDSETVIKEEITNENTIPESSTSSYLSDPNASLDTEPYLNEEKSFSDTVKSTAENIFNTIKDFGTKTIDTIKNTSISIADFTVDLVTNPTNTLTNVTDAVSPFLKVLGSGLGKAGDGVNAVAENLSELTGSLSEHMQASSENNAFLATLGGIASIMADNLKDYKDGVTETQFGAKAEKSWKGDSSKSFLDYFANQNKSLSAESRKINFLKSTPLDSTSKKDNIFGSMILGTPFAFNSYSDPTNRTLINSLVKDARYVSFTPGLPKFNGLSYNSTAGTTMLDQTKDPNSMLAYLTKNGLDSDFANKDKRYYTFKTEYRAYFAYLETMLNAVWIKMGLAKNGETFNLFTFFKINETGEIDSSEADNPKPQYNSSIGFFCNVSNAVSESISNNPSSDGDSLATRANQNAQEYQAMNYITGMGTGGPVQNATRKIGVALKSADQLKGLIGESLGGTIDAISNVSLAGGDGIRGLAKTALAWAKVPVALALDITKFNNTNDLGAVMQSFATSNGMMVKYPNLWSDSAYAKNINFNFSFVSPYGDPLSIFKYVYVPFFTLLAFAMPRQAAENGLVSPFLVRCDVPGLVTSDLALISDMTWTKGGANNLWTKDGLPRAIDVTVTVSDLYPYLAMSKRLSFLSANPSYAVFLDNLSGMLSLNDTNEDDGLNNYFKALINRVNGEGQNGTNMWNKFNSTKSRATQEISDKVRSSVSASIDYHAVPWFHNSSVI